MAGTYDNKEIDEQYSAYSGGNGDTGITPTQLAGAGGQKTYDWYDPNAAYGRVSNGNGGYTNEFTWSRSARDLQGMLNKEFNAGLDVDGYYGAKTAEAVKKYLGSGSVNPAQQEQTGATGTQGAEAIANSGSSGGSGTGSSGGAANPSGNSFSDRVKSPDNMTHDEFVAAQAKGPRNKGIFGQRMSELDKTSAENPWALSPDTMTMDTGVKDPEPKPGTPNYGSYYDGRSGGYLSDANKAKANRSSLESDFLGLYGYDAPSYATDEQLIELIQRARTDASADINSRYQRDNDALASHYTGGESSPAVTQNYGSYYDGRSGNDTMERRAQRQREEELRRTAEEQAAVWSQSPENMVLRTEPEAPVQLPSTPALNAAPPSPYRDQTTYGYGYSPYSPYVSGQPRTPAKDSTLRYYPNQPGDSDYSTYDEPVGPPAPTATQDYGSYYNGRTGNQYSTPTNSGQSFDSTHIVGQTESMEGTYSRWLREDMAQQKSVDQIMLEAMQAGLAGSNNAADYYNWIESNLRRVRLGG